MWRTLTGNLGVVCGGGTQRAGAGPSMLWRRNSKLGNRRAGDRNPRVSCQETLRQPPEQVTERCRITAITETKKRRICCCSRTGARAWLPLLTIVPASPLYTADTVCTPNGHQSLCNSTKKTHSCVLTSVGENWFPASQTQRRVTTTAALLETTHQCVRLDSSAMICVSRSMLSRGGLYLDSTVAV